jgi:hypothetical protein
MEAPEDVKEAIKNSKIKYDGKGNLVDVRYQSDIKGYAAWQAGNRQLNRELLEYNRMKEYYGENAPYKTLGAFRRARRSDNLSPKFKAWRYRQMDQNTFERWGLVKDFRNCPQTLDKLQEIKYNKVEQWELLKRERKTVSDINAKQWTKSFHDKAIDTYYHFREYGIEFTDHGVARFLQRNIVFDKVVELSKKPFNYIEQDKKYIKFYDSLAIIYTEKQKEIVSVVKRATIKGDWNEI